MATDGTSIFICSSEGHTYCSSFDGVFHWAIDYEKYCFALAVPLGEQYLLISIYDSSSPYYSKLTKLNKSDGSAIKTVTDS